MKLKQPSYDRAALAGALAEIAHIAPTQVSLERMLGEVGPLLRQIRRSGWTDEAVVTALTGRGVADEKDIVLLLAELRRRERNARKASSKKSESGKAIGKLETAVTTATKQCPPNAQPRPTKIIATAAAVSGFIKNRGL